MSIKPTENYISIIIEQFLIYFELNNGYKKYEDVFKCWDLCINLNPNYEENQLLKNVYLFIISLQIKKNK